MEIKFNKYVVYSLVIVLVALIAFNFEKITGYSARVEKPTVITITNLQAGDVIYDRTVARLKLENSFPNQRLKVYRTNLDKFTGYSLVAENCKTIGASSEYTCEADLYISEYSLEDGESYYFQALDRKANPDGNRAYFVFKK